MCTKRAFPSAYAAKCAHRSAGWRLRTYRCDECAGRPWHVTNQEKRRGDADADDEYDYREMFTTDYSRLKDGVIRVWFE